MSEETKDTGYAPDRWAFDEKVTAAFDDMLRRSVPRYDEMRRSVFEVGRRFVKRGTAVVDLGAWRGEGVAPLVDLFGAQNSYHLVEKSPPMLDVLRARFSGMAGAGVVKVLDLDLRTEFPRVNASLVQAVLTLQFTPIEHRQKIVARARDVLVPGGALVLVEKVLGETAEAADLFDSLYHATKRENGYSEDDVARKALSLEGVLVPVTATWNEGLLRSAGFRVVECFWRQYNFAAWVAVRE